MPNAIFLELGSSDGVPVRAHKASDRPWLLVDRLNVVIQDEWGEPLEFSSKADADAAMARLVAESNKV